jgi:outer membrane protein assembly factor BamB
LLVGLPAAAVGQAAATDPADPADPARHWNQFRGPSGDGHSPATGVPVTFGEESVRWKTPIHDEGWSSPVIWGDQVWVTTAREDGTQVFAVAVDFETGEIVHDIKVFDVAEPQVAWDGHNTHATPTPLIEDGRIYVHFGAYGTAALDTLTGEKLWERRDLKTDHRVRPASSPVGSGNALFLAFDGVDRQFAAALDKRDGKTIWLRNREIATDFVEKLRDFGVEDIEGVLAAKPNDNRKAYATSTVIAHEGRRQLVSPAAEVTFAYDPETGDELWRVVHEGWGWNVASRPVYADGLVYLTQGTGSRTSRCAPASRAESFPRPYPALRRLCYFSNSVSSRLSPR